MPGIMKIKYRLLFPIFFVILLTSGCGQPECSLIIFDATEEELLEELKDYSLSEDIFKGIITRESFNMLVAQETQDIILNVMNGNEVSCDSVRLTKDSLICNSEGKIILFSINEINRVEVYYSDRTLSLLRNSAILGTLTSSIALLGYIPPNPPQPNWKSFVGLFAGGFILGIIFDVSSSSYYCLISKASFINFVKQNYAKRNGI